MFFFASRILDGSSPLCGLLVADDFLLNLLDSNHNALLASRSSSVQSEWPRNAKHFATFAVHIRSALGRRERRRYLVRRRSPECPMIREKTMASA